MKFVRRRKKLMAAQDSLKINGHAKAVVAGLRALSAMGPFLKKAASILQRFMER